MTEKTATLSIDERSENKQGLDTENDIKCEFIKLPDTYLNGVVHSQLLFDKVIDMTQKSIDSRLSIGTTWDGIHYIFTGRSSINSGGKRAGIILPGNKVEYDPKSTISVPEYYYHNQLIRLSDILHGISRKDLQNRYDPATMSSVNVYPHHSWKHPKAPDFLWVNILRLREFISDAVQSREGLLVMLR